MPALAAIVKRIDHVVVQVDDPGPLFGLLSGPLGLPVAWPIQNHGWYASGGVFAGNASLEVARLGRARPRAAGSARLFGIALEPYPLSACLRELAARGIPHSLPVCFYGERPDGTRGARWTNVLLGGLTREAHARLLRTHWWAGDSIPGRVLDPVARMMALGHWARLATSPAGRHMVYICEYGYEMEEGLSARRAALEEAGGGPLGLVGLAEVVLGATNPERARQRWQNLLAPLLPVERGFWQPADGPGIRIVPHDEDTMLALVLRTRDLACAEAWLREHRMLGGVTANQVSIDPVTVQGLDVRLTQ
jgi:hypothetical protein